MVNAQNISYLKLISSGKHEIHFKGANSQFTTTGIQNFATEVTYNLEVS
jgi:hypothetical protein